MLTSIEITNFQSLQKVSIPLGRFTVVTGPTGSGKTAVIRALEFLVRNAPGTAYIRKGQGTCKVATGDREQGWVVAIERRTARGKDAYRLVQFNPGTPDDPDVETYTKLGGKVPDEVTRLLALTKLNFARQFDRPFLLDETGTDIARVLGELTNVTIVLNAAREAGRRRKGLDRDLSGAEARLGALEAQALSFAGLGTRRFAVAAAETHLERAQDMERRAERLRSLVFHLAADQEVAGRASDAAASWLVPSTAQLDAVEARLARLAELAAGLQAAGEAEQLWADREGSARRAEAGAHQAVHDALVAAGQCPLCGQATRPGD